MNARLTQADFAWENVWLRRPEICLTVPGTGIEIVAATQAGLGGIVARCIGASVLCALSTAASVTSTIRRTVNMQVRWAPASLHAGFDLHGLLAQGEN